MLAPGERPSMVCRDPRQNQETRRPSLTGETGAACRLYSFSQKMRSRLWKICIGCIFLAGLGFMARPFRGYWLLHSAQIESDRLYANFRPFLYRWVGVPYANSNGLGPANCTPIPENETLQLRLQTAEAEDILGPSARSLRLRGRAALLTCQPEESINQYQRALLVSPEDPGLHLELGIAFALNASPMNPLEYEGALEHIVKADQIRSSPESLYDSALLFQQAQLLLQASQRWADAAAAEPVAQWKADSSRRLMAMQDFLWTRKRQITSLSSPTSYLAAAEHQQREGEELALDMATQEWLAEIGQSPDAARAVQYLAALLLRDHHDHWLLNFLKMKLSLQTTLALAQLTEAVRLNLKGEHSRASDVAKSAEQVFAKYGSQAGALRARLEMVYSLDRQGNADDCLARLGVKLGDPETEAKPGDLETTAKQKKYTWIMAQARLEQVTCLTRKRRQDVIALRNTAFDLVVTSTGYSGLALRSLGFLTEPYVAAGSRLILWRRAQQGLATFWSKPLPIIRVYSFYYTLANSARNAGNLHAALAVLREGTLLLEGSGLYLIRGILLSSLGQWEMEAGLTQQADHTFAEMANEFKQVDPKEIAQVWDEAEVAHAEALVATGHARDGLTLLQKRTQGMNWPYPHLNPNLRRVLLPAFGNAYLRIGALQDSCQSFLQSIAETQDKMATVQSHAQRDDALREIESSWRGLTAVKLGLNLPSEALAVWETFRSGRNPNKQSFIFPNCEPAASPPSFALPEDPIALVYATLPTGLSGWLISNGKVEQRQLDSTGLKERVERLSTLVSDPNSSPEEISSLSTELYQMLLAPFADSLPASGTLIIDPDGELAAVPWNLLEERRGHPLVERFAVAQVIGILDLATSPEETQVGLERALIFGPPVLSGDLAYKYPFPHRAAEEAEVLHGLLPNSDLFPKEKTNFQTLKAYASRATLFHFAGHAISNGGFSALLLPQTRGSPPDRQYTTAE